MEIQVLQSGSKGNCYRLSQDGSLPLLLECGIRMKDIRQKLNFRLSDISGCLLTHEHGDHAKSAVDIMRAGIDLYCSKGTAEALDLRGHRLRLVEAHKPFWVGNWMIHPFDTVHDANEPLGFVVMNKGVKLLFATDTAYVKYRFKNLTHIMIEANWGLDILMDNLKKGVINPTVKDRVIRNHMSIDRAEKFIMANDLSKVRGIWLIHVSVDNGGPREFKLRIQKLTGKKVVVA